MPKTLGKLLMFLLCFAMFFVCFARFCYVVATFCYAFAMFRFVLDTFLCFAMFSYVFLKNVGFYKTGCCLFLGVLVDLGSSGKLTGTMSTYPSIFKCPWSRVIAKNHPGRNVLSSTVSLPCICHCYCYHSCTK